MQSGTSEALPLFNLILFPKEIRPFQLVGLSYEFGLIK